jgi:THO complex subunit 4
VTYSRLADARTAIREYDGANAKGQPIRLSLMPTGPAASRSAPAPRNPFDTARMPAKSLFERISAPAGRDHRSDSPESPDSASDDYNSRSRREPRIRHSDVSKPPPENIDRYVPSQRSRSRSPPRRRRGEGRRGGERREDSRRARDGGRDRDAEGRRMVNGRPRKTQEELDRDMEDYWGSAGNAGESAGANSGVVPVEQGGAGFGAPAPARAQQETTVNEDIDMIE